MRLGYLLIHKCLRFIFRILFVLIVIQSIIMQGKSVYFKRSYEPVLYQIKVSGRYQIVAIKALISFLLFFIEQQKIKMISD